jgi:outer membrane protein OmpA-like peptidoglycan-associated protein
LKNITQKEIFVSALGLFGSSKLTAKAVVIALVAGLLGAGAVVVAPADPANATSCSTTASVYAGGDGSSGSPFQIATAAQLIRLSLTNSDWQFKHFIQTADINLGNCVWAPIGDTTMTSVGLSYNGQGFTISGLRPSSPVEVEGTGLFGTVIESEIRNLIVKGSITYSETHNQYVGGVVGFAIESTLDNVRSEVDISVTTQTLGIGGLIGATYNVSISQSLYKGSIQTSSGLSADEAGGLVGWFSETLSISSSYALANFGVSSGVSRAGLIGKADGSLSCSRLTVSNSYFVGSGAEYGVLKDGDCGQYSDTFWNSEVSSGSATSSGPLTGTAARTTAQLKTFANFPSSWNIVDGWNAYSATAPIKTWGICSTVNSGYPFLLREHSSNPCTVAPPPSNSDSGSSGPVYVAPVVVPEVGTPRTIRQATIRQATDDKPARLLGRSLDKDVLFIADSARLSPEAKKSLRQAVRLAMASDSKVAVTGFAAITNRGRAYEKSVAQKRALAVARYLRAQGFDDWIYYQGLSGRQGLTFDGDPRRVEIRILK